jgi:hypothetical protein
MNKTSLNEHAVITAPEQLLIISWIENYCEGVVYSTEY